MSIIMYNLYNLSNISPVWADPTHDLTAPAAVRGVNKLHHYLFSYLFLSLPPPFLILLHSCIAFLFRFLYFCTTFFFSIIIPFSVSFFLYFLTMSVIVWCCLCYPCMCYMQKPSLNILSSPVELDSMKSSFWPAALGFGFLLHSASIQHVSIQYHICFGH